MSNKMWNQMQQYAYMNKEQSEFASTWNCVLVHARVSTLSYKLKSFQIKLNVQKASNICESVYYIFRVEENKPKLFKINVSSTISTPKMNWVAREKLFYVYVFFC